MDMSPAGSEAADAYFESLDGGPADDSRPGPVFGPLDAIYCISLQEQPGRTAAATRHFRDVGLSPVTLYRPRLGRHTPHAIWTSHREVARRALAMGHSRVLILEDDARFVASEKRLRRRLDRALPRLPSDWNGLFLGHIPLQAYPVGRGLLRTRSSLAHAYVANRGLLQWLADNEPMDPAIPICLTIGTGVDAAFANLPGMYALWPMAARAAKSAEVRPDCDRPVRTGLARFADSLFYRGLIMYRGDRTAEAVSTLLAPWHALTLEYFRRRSGRERVALANDILARGFDARAYLLANADVAASGHNPLEHYVQTGAREGRDPFPPLVGFDPERYLRANPDVAATGMDAVHHYLTWGRLEGRKLAVE